GPGHVPPAGSLSGLALPRGGPCPHRRRRAAPGAGGGLPVPQAFGGAEVPAPRSRTTGACWRHVAAGSRPVLVLGSTGTNPFSRIISRSAAAASPCEVR